MPTFSATIRAVSEMPMPFNMHRLTGLGFTCCPGSNSTVGQRSGIGHYHRTPGRIMMAPILAPTNLSHLSSSSLSYQKENKINTI